MSTAHPVTAPQANLSQYIYLSFIFIMYLSILDSHLPRILPMDATKVSTESIGPISAITDYENIERFAKTYPHRAKDLPDLAFSVLLMECFVECTCVDDGCPRSHERRWVTNIEFIIFHGKLHLIREFRLIAESAYWKPLGLSVELKRLARHIGRSLPNVNRILFLGVGLLELSSGDKFVGNKDPKDTKRWIYLLFPRVSDVRYFTKSVWRPSPGYLTAPTDTNPLYDLTFSAYFSQLEHVQLHIPVSLDLSQFCVNLTSLSINLKYVRCHKKLPAIPVRRLRVLHIWQIDDIVPWDIFKLSGRELLFDTLDELTLEFVVAITNQVPFPGVSFDICFPVLSALRVYNSTFVYGDVCTHFLDSALSELRIMDDQQRFVDIDWRVLNSIQRLTVQHPTGETAWAWYASVTIQSLFDQPSSMTEAYLIGHVPYMLPVNIAWHNLAKLQLFVTHADKDGIANMVAQLPVLEELAIECESMYLDDVGSSIYPDQRDTTEGLAIVVDEEDDSPISDTLKCFKVQTQQEFDIYGFCELVCRFLAVNVAVVKSYYVESVEDVLNWHYQGGRQISIQPYPEQ